MERNKSTVTTGFLCGSGVIDEIRVPAAVAPVLARYVCPPTGWVL
jgi:hypothetical protein